MDSQEIIRKRAYPGPWLAGLAVVLIVLGSLSVWWTVARADREMRADLLQQAKLVAEAVNVENIHLLSGTSADLEKPAYLRLKEQLAAARSTNRRCRFLYLMGYNPEGEVFFYADSEPSGSRHESPAGQIYVEASKGCHRVFATQAGTVDGPYTDRWGSWISALVPIEAAQRPMSSRTGAHDTRKSPADVVRKSESNPRSGDEPIACVRETRESGDFSVVLGMDIDVQAWKGMLARAAIPPVLMTLTMVAILATGSWLLARRFRVASARRWMRHLEPGLAAAGGLVLTVFAAWTAHERAGHNRREAFEQLAAIRTEAVAKELRDFPANGLESLVRFYEGSEHVTSSEFGQFTAYLTRNPAVQAWGWIPAVSAADKTHVEAEACAEGWNGFEVWQKDSLGKRVPAGGRDMYYPVFHIAPRTGNETLVGYDLGSEPLLRAALEEAGRTDLATAAAPIALEQEPVNANGMMICRRISGGHDPGRPCGFAVTLLRTGTLLRNATPDDSAFIELSLLHKDASPDPLAISRTAGCPPNTGLVVTRPVFAFGKVFGVTTHAGPEFMCLYPMWACWLAGLTGLALTAAIVIVTSVILRRREELERLVLDRTASLLASEEQLSATLRSIGDGVIASDAKGNVVSFNAVAESLTGWSTVEAQGHPIEDVFRIIHADAGEELEIPVGCVLRENRSIDLTRDTALIARDGTERRIAIRCAPMHDADGNVIGAVLVFRDVSEEYLQQERLREKSRELDRYFTSSLDLLCIADIGGHFIRLNPQWEKVLGYPLSELEGRSFLDLVHPDDRKATLAAMSRLAAQEEVLSFENRYLCSDGSYRWIEWRSHPQGEVIYAAARDVTDRKKVEESLRRSEEELKRTVAALESANRSLEDLNEKAETATRAKSEFLANMSHEIRTPMTAILGFTDVLLGEPDMEQSPPGRVEAIQTIQRNGKYLLELINDILDLSKIEAGKLDVERIACSPAQVLAEVADLMQVRADAKNVALTLEYSGGIPESIQSDPLRLRQILVNLVGNAVKFTETGCVRVVAYLVQRLGKPTLLRIDVIDTGIGLSQPQILELFTPFSQADSSTTRKFGGTGLGLTISKRLTEILGGDISVVSEPGKGSTFSVTVETGDIEGVRLLQSPLEAALPAESTSSRVTAAAVRLDCPILLAEDGPDNQRLITFLLRNAGATVTLAENGQVAYDEALAAHARGEPFAAILMDMQMPVMDGYDATRGLRQAGYQGPIIALTAYAMKHDGQKCLNAGCDAYLAKPIDRSTLLETIARFSQGRQEPAVLGWR
jgi:PAS domain S-box-containing protein